MILRLLACSAFLLPVLPLRAESPPPALTASAGQTVVLLGDAFLEREAAAGFLETLLTAGLPDGVKFRNLAWSGDTPRCEARSYFDPPAGGFRRLEGHLSEIKPSTVVACYGSVDAFRGEAGIADFLQSYGRLVDMIQKTSGAAVVIVSPPPVQTLPPPFPDMTAQNARLALYRDALRGFAQERGLKFVDILTPLSAIPLQTVNGVNLTDEGYRAAAGPVARALDVDPGPSPDDFFARAGAMRAAIVEKNRQFFYRWRPQNEIYLFGSRKHEQGQNGVEIPQFDPLVAAAEEKITALKAAMKPAVP